MAKKDENKLNDASDDWRKDDFLPSGIAEQPSVTEDDYILLSNDERDVLKIVLDRQRTSRLVHGGLKSLLTLTDDQEATLLAFLCRI